MRQLFDKPVSKMPEHRVYYNMRERCKGTTHNGHRYAGRGITICAEWSTFEQFYRDMGPRPGPDYQLDRIDNDKGYSKDNCRWVHYTINIKNKGDYRNNTSGVRGVSFDKKGSAWVAKGNGKYLYYGKDFFEAVCARKAFAIINHREVTCAP